MYGLCFCSIKALSNDGQRIKLFFLEISIKACSAATSKIIVIN